MTTADHSVAVNPSRLEAFVHWWSGELRAMTPPAVIGWVVGDVAVTDLSMDKTGIVLLRAEAGGFTVVSRISADAVATSPLLPELRAKGHDQIRLLLTADQVLTRKLNLPMAIEENLREAIGFELDRHTPFKAGQVYYDVKVLKRDQQRDSIEVGLVVAARNVVDPLVSALRGAGMSVASIGLVDSTPLGGRMPELLPFGEKPARRWGNLLKLNLGLLAGAVVLGLVALLLPIWQKRELVKELLPIVAKTGAEYETTVKIQDEYARLAGEYNFLSAKKYAAQPALAVLEELTRISPDTNWTQSLDLKISGKTRELTIIGEALSASKVIETLEQSPMFQNATQRSPTQRGSQPNTERYHVATEVKPKAVPAAIIPDEKSVAPAPVVAAPSAPAQIDKSAPAPAPVAATAPSPVNGAPEPASTAASAPVPAPGTTAPPVGGPVAPVATVAPAAATAPEATPKQLPLTVMPQNTNPAAAPRKQP